MPSNKTTHKFVYKPDSQSTDEFIIIIADVDAANKWIQGDKTIPLVDVVDAFDVFHSGQGSQGLMQRPSKQELETVFGTTNDTSIVEIILEKGRLISSDQPLKFGNKNDSQSGGYQTSRGATGGGR